MKRISLVVAILALFAGFVMAEPPTDMPPKGGPGGMHRQMMMEGQDMARPGACGMMDSLMAKIKPLKKSHQRDMMQYKSKLQSAEVELKLAITADKYDNGKVKDAIDKISTLKKDMLTAKIAHQKVVRDLLTPEQQLIFDQKVLNDKGLGNCGGKGMMGKGPGGCDQKGGPGGCKMMGKKMMGAPGGGECKMGQRGDDHD